MGVNKFLLGFSVFFLLLSTVHANLYSNDEYTSLYIPFNDCAGLYATDKSPFYHDGLLYNNPTWLGSSSCVNGCCLKLDGVNDFVSIADGTQLDLANALGIAFWYISGTGSQYILEKGYATETQEPNYAIKLEPPNDNEFCFRHSSTQTCVGSSNVANDNKFHCFVATRNSTHIMIYNDGVLTTTANSDSGNLNNNPLIIGYGFAPIDYANVTIDELMIENTTLNTTWANNYCNAVDNGCAVCKTWHSNNTCQNGVEQFVRDCPSWSTCTNTSYWESSDYCGKEYNRSQGIYEQKSQPITLSYGCASNWFEEANSGIAECSPPQATIPNDCTNITVFETLVPVLDMDTPSDNGNFTATVCTPSYNCTEQTESCSLLNNSYYLQKVNYDFKSGDVATGYSVLSIDNGCWRPKIFGTFIPFTKGIMTYKIEEQITIKCNKPCVEESYCVNKDYLGSKHTDCTYNISSSPCPNGCDIVNNVCYATVGSNTNPEGTSDVDKIVNSIFHPKANTRLAFALGSCGFVALVGIVITARNDSKNPLLTIILFALGWIIFTAIAWIPPIYTIILLVVGVIGFYFYHNASG